MDLIHLFKNGAVDDFSKIDVQWRFSARGGNAAGTSDDIVSGLISEIRKDPDVIRQIMLQSNNPRLVSLVQGSRTNIDLIYEFIDEELFEILSEMFVVGAKL